MKKSGTASVLIASLGTEAQVVTAALDLLRQHRERVERGVALHTSAQEAALAGAVERLRQEFG